eukprot:GHVP01036163.1.p1 GENE.GHVP01036163.1~~GHVP01036163.1.p1  ORF type:complete len:1004 (+),score=130.90 GHVP01036163.1:3-3014(+)
MEFIFIFCTKLNSGMAEKDRQQVSDHPSDSRTPSFPEKDSNLKKDKNESPRRRRRGGRGRKRGPGNGPDFDHEKADRDNSTSLIPPQQDLFNIESSSHQGKGRGRKQAGPQHYMRKFPEDNKPPFLQDPTTQRGFGPKDGKGLPSKYRPSSPQGNGNVDVSKNRRSNRRGNGQSEFKTSNDQKSNQPYKFTGNGSSKSKLPDCPICLLKVHHTDRAWHCSQCYALAHLPCITQWIDTSTSRDLNKPLKDQIPKSTWRCTLCQAEYSVKAKTQYLCWCEKLTNPIPNPQNPHSCEEPCGRTRVSLSGVPCPHPCTQLCHPGKCPPCNNDSVSISCHCGRLSKSFRCSESKSFSCEEICKKKKNCGFHDCDQICHEGPCFPCGETMQIKCRCGAEVLIVSCSDFHSPDFQAPQCQKICGKLFPCLNHTCQKLCHSPSCGTCATDPTDLRTCGCGRRSIESFNIPPRTKCTDLVPFCGGVCGVKLPCGHDCEATCHVGAHPPCQARVRKSCRCGRMTRLQQCADPSEVPEVCNNTCDVPLSCGKHKCKIVCCPVRRRQIHDDPSLLVMHECQVICRKPLPCGNHLCSLLCHIGPHMNCGVNSYNELRCACGQSVIDPPVPCGTPPPMCKNPCPKILPCSHKCPSTCHQGECQKCTIVEARRCLCEARELYKPCWVPSEELRCTIPCSKLFQCGHVCKEICHKKGECPRCTNRCLKKRRCGHRCSSICHLGECEDVPCVDVVTSSCECGRIKEELACGFWSKMNGCRPKQLECSRECVAEKRLEALSEKKPLEVYDEDLIQWALQNPTGLQKMREQEEKINSAFAHKKDIHLGILKNDVTAWMAYYCQNYYKSNVDFRKDVGEKTNHLVLQFLLSSRRPEPLLSKLVEQLQSSDINIQKQAQNSVAYYSKSTTRICVVVEMSYRHVTNSQVAQQIAPFLSSCRIRWYSHKTLDVSLHRATPFHYLIVECLDRPTAEKVESALKKFDPDWNPTISERPLCSFDVAESF